MSRSMNPLAWAIGAGLGLSVGWFTAQMGWVFSQLRQCDARRTLAHPPRSPHTGRTFSNQQASAHWTRIHTIEDGIERIVYTPKQRRFATPLVLQHGMWHGAWCWQTWQEALAEWGWETHAHSLPGHAASPVQRTLATCTLDYYLAFLKFEVERVEQNTGHKPVLLGHSMGGALIQWYLRYVGDDLPAAVLVAPWVSHAAMADGLPRFFRLDPVGCVTTSLKWTADYVRDPEHAARALLSPHSVYTPAELYARLTPESSIVMLQHNPPFWHPAENVQTPLLWLAGERDAVVGVEAERASAAHYGATFRVYPNAAHNLMMEPNHRAIAQDIHAWLVARNIA